MTTVKIASMNCRGLRDLKKRKDVFKYLRERKCDIYCLQDSHLVNDDNPIVHAQWGFNHVLSPGRNNARGVLNLYNNSFEYELRRYKSDCNTGGSLAMILGTDVRLESPNPTPFIYQAK